MQWLPLLQSTGYRVSRLQKLHPSGSVAMALGLESVGPVAVVHGLNCSVACGNLPGPGIEQVSPALTGGLLTTGPPGKPPTYLFLGDTIQLGTEAVSFSQGSKR